MNRSTPRKNGDTSPLRQSLQHSRRSLRHGHPSPSRDVADSPSRQLLHEFHRLLIDKEQHLQDDLDEQIEKQAELHRAALAFAASEHKRVRKNAEIARERVELEIERERKRREQEEKDRLEKERQAKVAREAEERRRQRELLERQQREDAAKAAEERELQERRSRIEEQTKKEAEEAARKKQETDDAAKQRAKEAAANAAKAREEAQKAVPQVAPAAASAATVSIPTAQAPQSAAQPVQSTTGQSDSLQQEFEHVHKQYLHMHKKLKEMREHVITESKKIPALKTKLGDWRREIVKCMGQLTADKTKNRKPVSISKCIFLPNDLPPSDGANLRGPPGISQIHHPIRRRLLLPYLRPQPRVRATNSHARRPHLPTQHLRQINRHPIHLRNLRRRKDSRSRRRGGS